MNKEFYDHMDKNHYEVVSRDLITEGESILDSVWAMKRKRNILTNQVYKWKSRLNLHRGQQEYAVNFYETFSPVINWSSSRLLLVQAIICKWHTRQVDFTMAFP